MCLFIITKKKKKKKKKFKRKRNIKSRKIDKRKRKMLVSKAFYNNESESETSTGSALLLYTSTPPSPPPSSLPLPIDSPPYYNMSQVNLHEIIRQQQEQLVTMQAQIQALLAGGAGGQVERKEGRGGGAEIAKPQIFDGTLAKVGGFIAACKLYIRMRLRGESVEGQVQ